MCLGPEDVDSNKQGDVSTSYFSILFALPSSALPVDKTGDKYANLYTDSLLYLSSANLLRNGITNANATMLSSLLSPLCQLTCKEQEPHVWMHVPTEIIYTLALPFT